MLTLNKYMLAGNVTFLYQPWELGKKIRRQFYFYFCRRKGQIRRHYDGKKIETLKLSEAVIIILFSAIRLFLYMFIRFLLVF